MSPRLRTAVSAVVVLPMIAGLVVAQTPAATYKKDQKVEIREGDVWSAATVLEQEGRRLHVKYDDGSDEWVPLARVRLPGTTGTPAAGGTPAGGATADKPEAKPAEPPKERLPLTGKCEVKHASSWQAATIKNRDGDLYLVVFDRFENRMHWAWVSSDCVRAVGSTKEGPSWGRSERVGGGTVEQAKAEAKRQLPKWKQEYKAEQENKAAEANGTEKRGAFDPKPYDKPVAEAQNTNIAEQQARRSAPNTYTPDAAVAANVDPITLAKSDRGSPRGEVLVCGKFAVSAATSGRDVTGVQVINLAAGSATPQMDFDPLSKPFAIANDGKMVVGRSDDFFGGTKLRLDFFDVTPAGLKHRVSFQPYGKASETNDRDVTFAAVIDGTVVTSNANGDLAGWTLSASGEPTVTCKWKTAVGGKAVALSPNGKTIAAARADGLYLIDPATGGTQAFVPATREPDRLTFTPDGKWVIGIDGPTLVAYDLVAATAAPDVGLPPGVFGRSVVGVAPGLVLLDSSYLFDLERHAVTWKYDNAADAFAACGRTWARVTNANRTLLMPAKLPDAAAQRAAVSAAEPLFKAGDSVSLEIAVEADGEKQTAIREHFTKELQRIGLIVADGRPVKLVVRTENGKSTQERYQTMGGAPWNRESADVTITDKISSVVFETDGKMAWQTMTTSRVGGMVSRKSGQGIAESVTAANQFNLGFFNAVRLPTFVSKPRTPLTAGSTNWAAVAGK